MIDYSDVESTNIGWQRGDLLRRTTDVLLCPEIANREQDDVTRATFLNNSLRTKDYSVSIIQSHASGPIRRQSSLLGPVEPPGQRTSSVRRATSTAQKQCHKGARTSEHLVHINHYDAQFLILPSSLLGALPHHRSPSLSASLAQRRRRAEARAQLLQPF